MKHTFKVSIWTGQFMDTRVLTYVKVSAPTVKEALDKAERKARALNSLPMQDPAQRASYLVCGGFFRLVS